MSVKQEALTLIRVVFLHYEWRGKVIYTRTHFWSAQCGRTLHPCQVHFTHYTTATSAPTWTPVFSNPRLRNL